MRPEDIDKLFKERLGNNTPTPPADLWNRLQERMQPLEAAGYEEETKVVPLLHQRNEKPGFTWLYTSIAAAVSLVLSVGVVFYNINTGTPEVHEALADKGKRIELDEKAVSTQAAPETVATAATEAANSSKETILTPQATYRGTAASNTTEAPSEPQLIAKATPKAAVPKPARLKISRQPRATEQPALAATIVPAHAADAPEPMAPPMVKPIALARADANLNAEPVEIIIRRSVAPEPALAGAADAPKGLNRKANLAKNIFKQMRNLASGENVELSEIGINADKVALNTQIGKQKFSKVINL